MKTSLYVLLSAAFALILASGASWVFPTADTSTQTAQSISGLEVIDSGSPRPSLSDLGLRNTPATGVFAGMSLNANGYPIFTGWAYDPNDQSKSVNVHFYKGGPAGKGTYVGKVSANEASPGLEQRGVRGAHSFSFLVPQPYRNTTDTWYAYAIDLQSGTPLLSGSAQKISIPTRTEEAVYEFPGNFSTTQGSKGWSYKYGSNGSYTNMTWDEKTNYWRGNEYYLQIGNRYLHPGDKSDAVVSWTAPSAGTVSVTGRFYDASGYCGDGVTVSVQNGKSVLWSADIANANAVGSAFSLTPTVKKGDTLSFVTNLKGTLGCDSTGLIAKIVYGNGSGKIPDLSDVPEGPDMPSCTLTASPATTQKGKAVSLIWKTNSASSIVIDQGIGKVSPARNGSRSVSPEKTTTYTAIVENGGNKATCSAQVAVPGASTITVSDPITVVPHHKINIGEGTHAPYIDAVPTTIVNKQTGERYWFNTDSFYWVKFKGTLDDPFQTKLWSRETGGLFGQEPFGRLEDPSRARYWLMNSWQDTDGGTLAFMHLEWPQVQNEKFIGIKGRIGLGWTSDYGETFKYLGDIIIPYQDKLSNMAGVPYFVKDGYFYIYYLDWCPYPATSVARAKVADVVAAARKGTVSEWKKYYNGKWESPGHKGACTALFPTTEGIIHSDASWSTYTNKAYMLLNRGNTSYDKNGKLLTTFVKLYESTDGIKWTPAVTIVEHAANPSFTEYGYAYNTIVDESGVNNGVVGQRFYVYSDKDAARGGPNGIIQRWTVDLGGKQMSEAEPEESVERQSMVANVFNAFRTLIGW